MRRLQQVVPSSTNTPLTRRRVLLALGGTIGSLLALSACGGGATATVTSSSAAPSAATSAATSTTATPVSTSASATTTAQATAVATASTGATGVASATSTTSASIGVVAPASTKPATAAVTVTEWSGWGPGTPEEKAFEAGVAKFNATHPDIHVDVTPGVDRTKKTEVAIAAGTPPDTGVPMGGAFITQWAANGEVQPLDSYIAAAKLDMKVFVAPLVHEASYQGKIYGLPLLFNDRAILWNKNELNQAGLPADTPPPTLEDMLSYAEKLTKTDAAGHLTQLGFSAAFPGLPGDYPGFWIYATAFNAPLFNSDLTQVTCDSGACVDVMDWLAQFPKAQHGYQAIKDFAATFGKADPESTLIAMNEDGEWKARDFPNPQDHGFAPIPAPKAQPDRKGVTDVDAHQLFIAKGAKEPDACFTFLSWITTDVPTTIAMAQASGNLPQLVATLDSAELRKNPNFAVYLDIAKGPNAQPLPISPIWSNYSSEIQKALDSVFQVKQTAQVALSNVKQVIQPQLDTWLKGHP
jgi:multiple sugar transport system substrate-binding protein